MKKIAIILYGPPGSGKGQQADLLADAFGLMHIDTGKLIRAIFSDPSQMKNPVNKREKKLNDAGILNTPSWVVGIVKRRVRIAAKMGYGVVFSGSPRTPYEAGKEIPFLEAMYGRKAVKFFFLRVPFAVAARRNRERYVCSVCNRPLLTAYYPSKERTRCPVCAGPLRRRIDDDPTKFATRTREYETRTKPAIEYVRRRGYRVTAVNGTPAPFKVFRNIVRRIK